MATSTRYKSRRLVVVKLQERIPVDFNDGGYERQGQRNTRQQTSASDRFKEAQEISGERQTACIQSIATREESSIMPHRRSQRQQQIRDTKQRIPQTAATSGWKQRSLLPVVIVTLVFPVADLDAVGVRLRHQRHGRVVLGLVSMRDGRGWGGDDLGDGLVDGLDLGLLLVAGEANAAAFDALGEGEAFFVVFVGDCEGGLM